ncbi:MAG: prolyl-tRNA synthetase associated domain-containing protein [Bacteroidales bacterium]|jgi:Ala-tRNA(Pro) deacylase|nr:prolyl-tRNA synthetase associated domain-containing protein [Bacteroidales bacterium]
MNGAPGLYELLAQLHIDFEYIEHPPAPTIEIAKKYWEGRDAQHCKNIFFRNHKGNRHYLVILNCDYNMDIHDLEQRLKQGKLSFASETRLMNCLGVKPGSVTPFGFINDTEHAVYLFLDKTLQNAKRLSFHPCINTASLIIKKEDLIRFVEYCGNGYEWIELY